MLVMEWGEGCRTPPSKDLARSRNVRKEFSLEKGGGCLKGGERVTDCLKSCDTQLQFIRQCMHLRPPNIIIQNPFLRTSQENIRSHQTWPEDRGDWPLGMGGHYYNSQVLEISPIHCMKPEDLGVHGPAANLIMHGSLLSPKMLSIRLDSTFCY